MHQREKRGGGAGGWSKNFVSLCGPDMPFANSSRKLPECKFNLRLKGNPASVDLASFLQTVRKIEKIRDKYGRPL